MRVLWTLLVVTAFAAAPALAQDPVAVDSAHYTLVFENDQVRVLRIRYGPQEESVMHDHPAGVVVYLADMKGQFTLPDGEVVPLEGKAGETLWVEAGLHQPKNVSDEPFELILVEVKEPAHGGE